VQQTTQGHRTCQADRAQADRAVPCSDARSGATHARSGASDPRGEQGARAVTLPRAHFCTQKGAGPCRPPTQGWPSWVGSCTWGWPYGGGQSRHMLGMRRAGYARGALPAAAALEGDRAAMAAFMCGGCHTWAVIYGRWPLFPPGLALGQVDAGQ
jgi:hypothetical protein